MKSAYLLVNLLVVGAALFAYDTLRSDPLPLPAATSPVLSRVEEAPAPAEAPRDLVLAGTGIEAIQVRLDRMARRLEELEKAGAERPGRVVADSTTPYDSPASLPAYQVPEVGDPDRPLLQPEEVTRFRALLDAVEKQRRDERLTQSVVTSLDRLQLDLRPEQKDAVVRETLAYREGVRMAIQATARSGGADKRMETIQPLRQAYETRIYEIVPNAEAQKIVESIGGYPGMGQFARSGNAPGRPDRDR
jgi:hypothetical protein